MLRIESPVVNGPSRIVYHDLAESRKKRHAPILGNRTRQRNILQA